METFPKRLKGRKYYEPGNLGLEKEIQKRIDWWDQLKSTDRRKKPDYKSDRKK
jgi:putative ATPase